MWPQGRNDRIEPTSILVTVTLWEIAELNHLWHRKVEGHQGRKTAGVAGLSHCFCDKKLHNMGNKLFLPSQALKGEIIQLSYFCHQRLENPSFQI